MTREWRDRIERVMVLKEGFAWDGRTFASLSGVAFATTGVKWNGYRFFFGAQGRNVGDARGTADSCRASKWRPRVELNVRRRRLSSTVEAAP